MGGSVRVESELDVGTTFIMQMQTQGEVPSKQAEYDWLKKNAGEQFRNNPRYKSNMQVDNESLH